MTNKEGDEEEKHPHTRTRLPLLPAGFLTNRRAAAASPRSAFPSREFARRNCPRLSCKAGKSTPWASTLGLTELEKAARPRIALRYYGYRGGCSSG